MTICKVSVQHAMLRAIGAALLMTTLAALPTASAALSADVETAQTGVKDIVDDVLRRCQYDFKTYCSDVTPGEGRLAFCLMAHANKRSPQCTYALFDAQRAADKLVESAIQSCATDIKSFCSGTAIGDGRIAQCLLDNKSSLSQACDQVVDVVAKVIFPVSNQPAVAETEIVDTPTEAVSQASAPAANMPSGAAVIDALDAKVASIVEKGKKGCQADLDEYCSGVAPGEGRLAFCLIAHADKRSPACESALTVARSEAETLIGEIDQSIQACAPDIASLCSGTEPGEGRIAQCLADQRGALSASCGDVLDKLGRVIFPAGSAKAASVAPLLPLPEVAGDPSSGPAVPADTRAAVLTALDAKVQEIIEKRKSGCAADLETYCSSVTPGEGRLALCLTAHADKRSAACEAALAGARADAETLITELNQSIEGCAPDVAALCSGTAPGEGRIAQCLADQRAAVGETCGRILDSVGKIIFQPGNTPVLGYAAPAAGITTGAISAPVPAAVAGEKQCQTVAASVTDWGQDATSKDASKLLKKRLNSFVAKRALVQYTAESGDVACSSNLNLGAIGYYTCKASTKVCWPNAGPSLTDSKATPQ